MPGDPPGDPLEQSKATRPVLKNAATGDGSAKRKKKQKEDPLETRWNKMKRQGRLFTCDYLD